MPRYPNLTNLEDVFLTTGHAENMPIVFLQAFDPNIWHPDKQSSLHEFSPPFKRFAWFALYPITLQLGEKLQCITCTDLPLYWRNAKRANECRYIQHLPHKDGALCLPSRSKISVFCAVGNVRL